jgi:hypothetical protein
MPQGLKPNILGGTNVRAEALLLSWGRTDCLTPGPIDSMHANFAGAGLDAHRGPATIELSVDVVTVE